jgi:hypothetical protein
MATAFLGAFDGYLGLLAGVMRRWRDATAHFEVALETNRRMGSPASVAITQLGYARMLLDKGGRNARTQAHQLLDAAAAASRTLDLPGHLAEAEALLNRC